MDATVIEPLQVAKVADRRQRAQVHTMIVIERGRPNMKAAVPALADLVEAVMKEEEEKA